MSVNPSEKLLQKIEQYKKLVEEYQEKLQQVKIELDGNQKNIEKEVLSIVSNRSLTTQERTEQMIPLMEKQDRLKDFLEDLATIIKAEKPVE